MKHQISHNLSDKTAKRVCDAAFAEYKKKFSGYSPTFKWVNAKKGEFALTAMGAKISGHFVLGNGVIDLDITVPGAFKVFEGRALKAIQDEVQEWLNRAEAGDF